MCGWLRRQGWRILADVSEVTARQLGCRDIAELAQRLGLWGLRLDDGFTLEEACALAARMPVAVNASTTTEQQGQGSGGGGTGCPRHPQLLSPP